MNVFKVIAYLSIATAIVAILPSTVFAATEQVETPTFSPSSGMYFTEQSVSIMCSTNGAKIYYTTDGSDPTPSSIAYLKPILVNTNMTLKAKAFKNDALDSQIASATYQIILDTVDAPTFNPPEGSYFSSLNVTISCATSGATIYYTIDGSEPTFRSTKYSNPILVNSNITIKAKTSKTGLISSDTVSANYVIEPIPAPTFNPAGGIFTLTETASVIAYINCSLEGATIRYTVDGSEPTASSTQYKDNISISSNITIKAKTFLTGIGESNTASATFTLLVIQPTQVSTPILSPAEGFYTTSQSVTIHCSTVGAIIYYTLDGSDPSITSSVYSIPIVVNSTITIKAKAFCTGMLDSTLATATYTYEPSSDVSNTHNDRSLALVLFVVLILCFVGFMLYYEKK